MTIRRIRTTALALITLGTTVLGVPGTVHAATSPLPCAQVTGGSPSYNAPAATTSTTTGKGKNAVITTTTSVTGPGTFTSDLQLGGATCPGATYTFTISSPDTTNLHWTTGATSGTNLPPTTTVYPAGGSVSVALTGDGTGSLLTIKGTTGDATGFYQGLCVNASVTISLAGQTLHQTNVLPACTGGSGGSGWF